MTETIVQSEFGIPQQKIMDLLKEAADSSCPNNRLTEIHVGLTNAAAGGDEEIKSTDDQEAGIRTVLDSLYVDTIKNNRQSLPSLFPVFATICGSRDKNSLLTDIDWSVK